jgi:hypothetical protein
MEMISGRLSNRLSITFENLLLVVVFVFVSLAHYLNEERTFAVFANELFVVAGFKLSSTKWTKRDFNAHVVLNTRMIF